MTNLNKSTADKRLLNLYAEAAVTTFSSNKFQLGITMRRQKQPSIG